MNPSIPNENDNVAHWTKFIEANQGLDDVEWIALCVSMTPGQLALFKVVCSFAWLPPEKEDRGKWLTFLKYFRKHSDETQVQLRSIMTTDQRMFFRQIEDEVPKQVSLEDIHMQIMAMDHKVDKISRRVGCVFYFVIALSGLILISSESLLEWVIEVMGL